MDTKTVSFPCRIDREKLLQKLHVKPGSRFEAKVDELIQEAAAVACPKIAYRIVTIGEKGDDSFVIDGCRFTSRELCETLAESVRAVIYVATCGSELRGWAEKFSNLFDQYCADTIMAIVLQDAEDRIFAQLVAEMNLTDTRNINPGALTDWDLEDQKHIFALLGDVQALTGVELTVSNTMDPFNSIAGIFFGKE